MATHGSVNSSVGLETCGLSPAEQFWNLTTPTLYEHALKNNEGMLTDGGALAVTTGEHTGRSPNDKFIVKDTTTADTVWWGNVNRPFETANFDKLLTRVQKHFETKSAYIQDCYAGADTQNRLKVRVITETAWHNLFARNMFINESDSQKLASFAPDFTVIQAPSCLADPQEDGTNSGTFVVINFSRKIVLIGGTEYAGEIKKSVFSILNYLLPEKGILPMHCSANVGENDDVAVFFGLSGTGKTTLSADSSRTLIGDDEHGWSDSSVFNFEGGCYAKVIKLDPLAEPEIYATTRRFGTVMENVVVDKTTRMADLDDGTLTENTRASYPIEFIPNASATGTGPLPQNVVMLSCDAFGVLPPISKLTKQQAMYHFLSGYTAKVAGTEKGLGNEPQATFSACFGAPFMARHPMEYAKLLGEKIEKGEVNCWLVNTGWTGGAYGEGKRMSIAHTRALLHAALDGSLASAGMQRHPIFGLAMPDHCPGVPTEVLDPRRTWADKDAYDAKATEVLNLFRDNFKQFENVAGELADAFGPAQRAARAA